MMASSIVKLISKTLLNTNYKSSSLLIIRQLTTPKLDLVEMRKPKIKKTKCGTIKHRNLIRSSNESLPERGFLRSYKPYNPIQNVRNVILGFCRTELGINPEQDLPLSREDKFVLLKKCFEELNHSVPNSLLHKIVSVKDIIEFYETPVSTTTPYDKFKNEELPPNLHIQYDYIKTDPKSDTVFKGIEVFNRPRGDIIFKKGWKKQKKNSFYPEVELY